MSEIPLTWDKINILSDNSVPIKKLININKILIIMIFILVLYLIIFILKKKSINKIYIIKDDDDYKLWD